MLIVETLGVGALDVLTAGVAAAPAMLLVAVVTVLVVVVAAGVTTVGGGAASGGGGAPAGIIAGMPLIGSSGDGQAVSPKLS